jgi:hypothetical protein
LQAAGILLLAMWLPEGKAGMSDSDPKEVIFESLKSFVAKFHGAYLQRVFVFARKRELT